MILTDVDLLRDRAVEFTTIDINRIANQQIVETWHVEELLNVFFQLRST